MSRSLLSFGHPRHWLSWLGIAIMFVASWLPLPLIRLIGQGTGLLLYALHTSRRCIVRRNLGRCFPEWRRARLERTVRAHFRAFGQTLFDNGIAWWAPRWRLKSLVRLRGRRHYDDALAKKQNVILLVPHFLGLEVAVSRLSMERPMVTVFRHPDNEVLKEIVERGRARFGLQLIEHNKPFTSLVRAVKSGAPLYYLPDQDAGRRHSVFAPFFGIPAATFTTLGRLAKMTGAAVIPCIAVQRPWGIGYEVSFLSPLENFPLGDELADTTRMNAVIEEMVRRYPAQYFWLHKRFKTRPEGEGNFYK